MSGTEQFTFNGIMDLDEARRRASAVVAAKGRDFRYREARDTVVVGCMYVTKAYARQHWNSGDDQDPGPWPDLGVGREDGPCLIGAILDDRGDTWHHHQDFEHSAVDDLMWDAFTQPARDYLGILQDKQDQGSTWGEALDAAEETVAA